MRQADPELKKAYDDERAQPPESRRCSGCGITKPLTSDYFTRRSLDAMGFNHACVPCAKAYRRKWQSQNADRVRQYRLRADRKRYEDPKRRISIKMASSIRYAIGSGKSGKRWESLVGYSVDDLMLYIERQFTKGMSWDNIGDWHIDHIVPVKSFKFTSVKDTDFKACWALSNLRPLWAKDNMTKHAKRLFLI